MSSRLLSADTVVCKVCVGQTMRLSAPCVDCNNTTAGYTEDRELRIVLMGYKRVCRYLDQAKYVMKWGSLDGGTNLTLRDIVVEGSRLADEFRLVEPDVERAFLRRRRQCLPSERRLRVPRL
ncbi:hypothetical protein HPB48_006312 [Haemaphysalis longicornis]|uniref:E3 ubiquitin-protein ligase Msl2 zinc RING finger domain-containing protein n=1 Tax=Haemaphysalis longicornis TaxID=44386 RepID=A0A9J6G6P0_HAELO|nr:hypothetical protein HPB48_006312 [Haemaphysalis longicornis]